jgi:hypothetical protein
VRRSPRSWSRDARHAIKTCNLVLPITAIIETGNHIAQIGDGYGNARRECAQKFSRLIEMMIAREAPWVLHSIEWDERYLRTLLDGAGTGSSLVDLAIHKFGCGDLSILAEVERYLSRTTGVDVDIWTLDWSTRILSPHTPSQELTSVARQRVFADIGWQSRSAQSCPDSSGSSQDRRKTWGDRGRESVAGSDPPV